MLSNHCVEGAWIAPTSMDQNIAILLVTAFLGFFVVVVVELHILMVKGKSRER